MKELAFGQRCVAKVHKVANFGLFLSYGETSIFVDMPEISWVGPWALRCRYGVGDEVEVLVLKPAQPDLYAFGSIRALHPECSLFGRVQVNDVLMGMVKAIHDDLVSIELGKHLRVEFNLEYHPVAFLRSAKVGDMVKLQVTASDPAYYLSVFPLES